jgi:hypothetical protein
VSSRRSCPRQAHFEQASQLVTEDAIAEAVPCGPDLSHHAEQLQAYADAGVDELYVQQVGPNLDGFFSSWAPYILERFDG